MGPIARTREPLSATAAAPGGASRATLAQRPREGARPRARARRLTRLESPKAGQSSPWASPRGVCGRWTRVTG